MNRPSVNQLVQLAMEASKEDPIDFGMLSINEEDSYGLVAMSLLDNEDLFHPEHGQTILLVSLAKVLVENMVLNLKLLDMTQKMNNKLH